MKYLKILFLIALIPHLSIAQNQNRRLDSLFSRRLVEGGFNGNVLIADKGKIIFEKSYGLANRQTGIQLDNKSIFNLASLSKQFTAMAIVLLKNLGKLSLEDPISKYIPELDFYGKITISNLLGHTSGLPDYMTLMEKKWDKTKIANNHDVIALMATERPVTVFAPGERFSYSNTGYVLLASIIEKASGQSYANYLNTHIFSPCKMTNTSVIFRHQQKPTTKNMTAGYVTDSLGQQIIPEYANGSKFVVYLDGVYGQGRIFSTARDLLKWDRVLYTEDLVSAADKKLIFSSGKTNDGQDSDYGLGWMIDDNKLYGMLAYHSGSWPGYATYIERHLNNDKTIISTKEIRKIIYNLPILHRIELSVPQLNVFIGKYKTASGKEVDISTENGKLYVPMNAQVKLELIPISANRFLVDGYSPEVVYEFVIGSDGKVSGYLMEQKEMGVKREAIRIWPKEQ